MPSSLSARIAAARRYARLSQGELAAQIGVSRPAVSQWENPDPDKGTAPSRENLKAVSRVTGAPMSWLLNDEDDIEPAWAQPQAWEAGDVVNVVRESAPHYSGSRPMPYGDPIGELASTIPPADVTSHIECGQAPVGDRIPLDPETVDELRFAAAVKRDFVFVPLLDMRVSAGGGRNDASSKVLNWFAFRRDWITESMRLDPYQCGLVIARGDSGGDDIRDGDLLLVDFRVQGIVEAGTYVLAIDGDYIVKQAQRNWDGSIVISSANPAYAPSTVPADRVGELTVVGLVRSQQRRR